MTAVSNICVLFLSECALYSVIDYSQKWIKATSVLILR
ncbi:hypothetical protein GLYMA_11G236050v4 [Glycine max]|nr:hypothetical protein GLYMA_11G236050v4 [Glycine max]KAH1160511.1 hypothetical protein GYH30_032017 [Glycine max]